MYLTLEVRWFYPGELPGQLVNWLDQLGCLPAAQPPREDHYLRLPGQSTLGIKLREGNVEVKTQLGNSRQLEIGPAAAGQLALCRKWSFPLALEVAGGITPLEQLLVPGSAWISVEKERWLQRYRLAAGQEAVSAPLGAPAALGCEFELSRVRASGEEWWSVCFEAFGLESGLQHALLATATKVLGSGWPLPLDVEHSLGYPAWLEHLDASEQ